MKPLMIKGLLVGALVLFGVIILMILIGAIACILGAEDKFYCGTFRCIGIIALIITGLSTGAYLIKSLIRN